MFLVCFSTALLPRVVSQVQVKFTIKMVLPRCTALPEHADIETSKTQIELCMHEHTGLSWWKSKIKNIFASSIFRFLCRILHCKLETSGCYSCMSNDISVLQVATCGSSDCSFFLSGDGVLTRSPVCNAAACTGLNLNEKGIRQLGDGVFAGMTSLQSMWDCHWYFLAVTRYALQL